MIPAIILGITALIFGGCAAFKKEEAKAPTESKFDELNRRCNDYFMLGIPPDKPHACQCGDDFYQECPEDLVRLIKGISVQVPAQPGLPGVGVPASPNLPPVDVPAAPTLPNASVPETPTLPETGVPAAPLMPPVNVPRAPRAPRHPQMPNVGVPAHPRF